VPLNFIAGEFGPIAPAFTSSSTVNLPTITASFFTSGPRVVGDWAPATITLEAHANTTDTNLWGPLIWILLSGRFALEVGFDLFQRFALGLRQEEDDGDEVDDSEG